MPDMQVLKKSVTFQDYTQDAGKTNGVVRFMVGSALNPGLMAGIPPIPPPYWSPSRDQVLRATVHFESMWAGAIYTACTKIASLSWQVEGDVALQVKRAQELLLSADDNQSWVTFISKLVRAFLLTDNGAFIEIIRASSAPGSRVLGLQPLSSARCRRTGDPEIPVIYRDRQGEEHELKRHQIIMLADMPDDDDNWFGVGFCAASRAYKAIHKLAGLETYVDEKVTGRRPLAIHFVNNVTQGQIDTALQDAELSANARGQQNYVGAVVVGLIDPQSPAGVATVDLAGLPERFDPGQERQKGYLTYAEAIGLDPQDIDPELLGTKTMGSGSQSRIIDDKASGKGLVAFMKQFIHGMNYWILPEKVLYSFQEGDLRDQIQKANLETTRTNTQMARIQSGMITAAQGAQILADNGDIPREFIEQDMTPLVALTDVSRSTDEPAELEGDVKKVLQEQWDQLKPLSPEDMMAPPEGMDRSQGETGTGQPLSTETLPGQSPTPDNEKPPSKQKAKALETWMTKMRLKAMATI